MDLDKLLKWVVVNQHQQPTQLLQQLEIQQQQQQLIRELATQHRQPQSMPSSTPVVVVNSSAVPNFPLKLTTMELDSKPKAFLVMFERVASPLAGGELSGPDCPIPDGWPRPYTEALM